MEVVYPIRTKAVSITGASCALSCSHCRGHYLKHMEDLWRPNNKNEEKVVSYLISGGCDFEGAVPLIGHIDEIKELGQDFKVIAHSGLLCKDDIDAVTPHLDAVSFNMLGSTKTISDIYHLDKGVEDFVECYDNLKDNVRTYPHITIGLQKGRIDGEYDAVDLLAKKGCREFVFNVIIPTRGTEFQDIEPPEIPKIIDVVSYTKQRVKDPEIFIGCMRPGGRFREELDERLIDLGIDRIVMPGKKALKNAKERGLSPETRWECCIL